MVLCLNFLRTINAKPCDLVGWMTTLYVRGSQFKPSCGYREFVIENKSEAQHH